MRHYLYSFVLILLIAAPARAEIPEFFAGLVDVPVMPGLTQEPDQAVVFDAPGGRVVQAQAFASGGLSKDDILGFYTASLPQLGWAAKTPQRYVRDGERLDIKAFQAGEVWAVRLTLAPL